ncbi:MAG: flagellar biosynthesis protein FlhF [Pseudomonadota bacterium]|jgi:flagellar biosynthesis protein FlhF
MNVRRYFAQSAREALRKLKEDLGADAVVLSNRSVEGGVEILALPADEVPGLPAAAEARTPRREEPARATEFTPWQPPAAAGDDDFTVSLSSARPRAAAVARPSETQPRGAQERRPQAPRQEVRATEAREAAAPAAAASQTDARLMQELAAIKGLIEQQLAGFAWGDMARAAPAKTLLLTEMLDAGFSAQLARRLVDGMGEAAGIAEARKWLRSALDRSLLTVDSDADIIDRGGVFALVGPTGVGKTTTTAKLAARCVVRHGADKLALLTTDGYRIGAHEQLRIYGRILGVPVYPVRDGAQLRQTLAELRNKHMVLIDTVGMSQRDRMVAEQASMLINAGDIRRLLLLNATSRGDTLDDVVRAYRGPDLAGVIITKVDEAVSLAPALDVLIRHELDLFYIANGQRVPEDLHLPNRPYLLHRAMKELPDDSPHHLNRDEAGLLLAAAHGAGAPAPGARLG